MFESLVKFLAKVWEKLKKIWVAIVSFVTHIADWFKKKYQEVIQKRPNVGPIVLMIQEGLESGNYSLYDMGLKGENAIVKTFYDADTQEILEEYTEVIESDELDDDTINAFGDKNMLVLK